MLQSQHGKCELQQVLAPSKKEIRKIHLMKMKKHSRFGGENILTTSRQYCPDHHTGRANAESNLLGVAQQVVTKDEVQRWVKKHRII